jgi:hypothetical protein
VSSGRASGKGMMIAPKTSSRFGPRSSSDVHSGIASRVFCAPLSLQPRLLLAPLRCPQRFDVGLLPRLQASEAPHVLALEPEARAASRREPELASARPGAVVSRAVAARTGPSRASTRTIDASDLRIDWSSVLTEIRRSRGKRASNRCMSRRIVLRRRPAWPPRSSAEKQECVR